MPKEVFVTPEINLLPQDDLETRPGGKFLKWALSWGKKIVVLTELLVVLAFLSRFKLDTDVANLSDEIDKRKVIIEASQEFENKFRTVQESLNTVKKINQIPSALAVADSGRALLPGGVAVVQVESTNDHLSVNGGSSDQTLSQMLSTFRNSRKFEDVIVERVAKQSQNSDINFSLTASYIVK